MSTATALAPATPTPEEQAILDAYQKTERHGLEFGRLCYEYRAKSEVVSGGTYTGTSAPFKDISLAGFADYRSVPIALRGAKVGNKRAWASDPNAVRKERSIKNRYVWFANPADKQLLHWPVVPYPTTAAVQKTMPERKTWVM